MLLGKFDSFNKYYKDFIAKNDKTKINIETFENSFSLARFENKKIKPIKLTIDKVEKFTINYPYIALLSDSKIQKLQFGYKLYELNIGPIITSFYSGTKFIYSIVSFVDKHLSAKLIYDEKR